jgi:hypothetical protein
VPGVELTHRGDRCSFDAMFEKFELRQPALDKRATIVRGADTDRLDLAPQCAGLLAISLGLGRLIAADQALLAQALVLYDALYAWCQDPAPERHAWNDPV